MIYIVILNYNSSTETLNLLENLKSVNLSVKVLIIDNNSHPLDQEKLKTHVPSHQLIINEKNLGYAGGNNIGIKQALEEGAEYIWILNPDIRVNSETLHLLLEVLQEDEKVAAVGPRIIHRENDDRIFSDGGLVLKNENCTTVHKNQNGYNSLVSEKIDYDIDYIDGSCMLLSSKAVKKNGLFSEEYFLYFEETDWCRKAKQNGYKIAVNSKAKAYNLISYKGAVFHFYMMRNRLMFARKFDLNYTEVRNHQINLLFKEFFMRFKGKYFKPFYLSRFKGFLAGIIKT